MKTLTTFALSLLFLSAAHAQGSFAVTKVTSLSATAEVITVQGSQAASVRLVRVVTFKGFDASCSAACTITLERDGTAATTATLTPLQLNTESLPPTAVAFSGSNVGTGTVLAQYNLTAGGQIAVSLAGKQLFQGFENLTIRTSSITGTVYINVQWQEQ